MLTNIRKNLDLIIVGFIFFAIVLYDITFELLEELFHLILELLHTVFEWVELGVEGVVEHAFHAFHLGETVEFLFITERHGGQVVTFYILMGMIAFILFKLSGFARRGYEFIKRAILMAWIRRKTECQLFWYSLSRLQKAALIATAVGLLGLASLFVI